MHDEIITSKHHFYMNEKVLELFCIKNDFANYFAKYCNLFIFAHNGTLFFSFVNINVTSILKLRCLKK